MISGDQVNLAWAMGAIRLHSDRHTDFDDDCLFCHLVAMDTTCSECDQDMIGVSNQPGQGYGNGPYDGHLLCHWTVLQGCEGFITTSARYAHMVDAGMI